MNTRERKTSRLRLDQDSYERLRIQVLRRDNWRCQLCGVMSNLEVHHQRFRSHGGVDSQHNLITLCRECHRETHAKSDGISAAQRSRYKSGTA